MTELTTCLLGEGRDLIDQVLDKWSLPVLAVLHEQPRRFNELRREIPAVTQKVLTQTLKRLEHNGIVQRTVLQTRPFAVQYSLTQLGHTLETPLSALAEWVEENYSSVLIARNASETGN